MTISIEEAITIVASELQKAKDKLEEADKHVEDADRTLTDALDAIDAGDSDEVYTEEVLGTLRSILSDIENVLGCPQDNATDLGDFIKDLDKVYEGL